MCLSNRNPIIWHLYFRDRVREMRGRKRVERRIFNHTYHTYGFEVWRPETRMDTGRATPPHLKRDLPRALHIMCNAHAYGVSPIPQNISGKTQNRRGRCGGVAKPYFMRLFITTPSVAPFEVWLSMGDC